MPFIHGTLGSWCRPFYPGSQQDKNPPHWPLGVYLIQLSSVWHTGHFQNTMPHNGKKRVPDEDRDPKSRLPQCVTVNHFAAWLSFVLSANNNKPYFAGQCEVRKNQSRQSDWQAHQVHSTLCQGWVNCENSYPLRGLGIGVRCALLCPRH